MISLDRRLLEQLIYGADPVGNWEVVSDVICTRGQYSESHRVILHQMSADVYYELYYDEPVTNDYDVPPWPHEFRRIDAHKVQPVKLTVTEYRRASDD